MVGTVGEMQPWRRNGSGSGLRQVVEVKLETAAWALGRGCVGRGWGAWELDAAGEGFRTSREQRPELGRVR